MDKASVLLLPHKFSTNTNAKIPFTKVDLNPKHFTCFNEMLSYLSASFDVAEIKADAFRVSRLDVAADLEDFPIDAILSILRVDRIRAEGLSFFKGTIYAGTDPKIKIYEKVREIKARLKKGYAVTDYERGLVDSGKSYTRFEIQIRNVGKRLDEIASDPLVLASYFDRLEVFRFPENENVGVLQVVYKYVNRKFRQSLARYRDYELVETIKRKYGEAAVAWFNPEVEPF